MKDLYLKPGDIVAIDTESIIADTVKWLTKIWSKDNYSWANHALFMKNEMFTFEAAATVCSKNFYEAYKGKHLVVGRFKDMSYEAWKRGWDTVKYMQGKWYPAPRLLLFLVPLLPKYFVFSKVFGFGVFSALVCSELVGLFCHAAGMEGWESYRGLTPDDIADRIIHWKTIDVVFEGKL